MFTVMIRDSVSSCRVLSFDSMLSCVSSVLPYSVSSVFFRLFSPSFLLHVRLPSVRQCCLRLSCFLLVSQATLTCPLPSPLTFWVLLRRRKCLLFILNRKHVVVNICEPNLGIFRSLEHAVFCVFVWDLFLKCCHACQSRKYTQ